MKTKIILTILLAIVIVESSFLAMPYLSTLHLFKAATIRSNAQSVSFPFDDFNRPVTNNTDHDLSPIYTSSWEIDIDNSLLASARNNITEAELAFAPSSSSESTSIPTIIVQERADGLLRVEYFAQSWPHSYGLVLYNSTTPGWTTGTSVTILFRSFGPPSSVNPQLAPRPNGNLDIMIAGTTVLSEYSIAWASLSELYLYGYPGSSFVGGSLQVSFYEILQA